MLTFTPTRLVTIAASQPAFAEVCVQPAPPTSTATSTSIIRSAAGLQIVQHVFLCTALRAQSTVSATGKVHSIPIQPPR